MTFETRFDGTRYPNKQADCAVLREETDPRVETELGWAYHRTLGDLIVDVLAGGPLPECGDCEPDAWGTLEGRMLQNAALEVRALNIALEFTRQLENTDELKHPEVCHLMRSLSRRLEAGAELAHRLRQARWGHPSFGGGENWEATQNAAKVAKAEAAQ